ncbi:alanine--tRNA ligase [Teredinibacter turnerae T7901]|uniref:Alanine--tRNA ligase n=1 Tax=Teredinibacter turnerae (strain ATCC 39867 / T7901) TaxID=377629 RepID=C5BTJ1_TERTT|nr:alanyl-tRNA editing protein [Teredinibacter turnerae]ACR12627.1 alanine--tRNA ligase [Teredinibacter turnerae T7901]
MSLHELVTHPIYDDEPYSKTLEASLLAIKENFALFDKTIFYPLGGGQPGDTGTLEFPDGTSRNVTNTYRDREQTQQIWLELDTPLSEEHIGLSALQTLNWDRRYRHMQFHTCLHLLCALVDAPVTGCNISEDKARLDFDLPEPSVTKEGITEELNALIQKAAAVTPASITPEELASNTDLIKSADVAPPAYNGRIRLVKIEGIDTQPCGGTHVKTTSEINTVVCTKIKKVSKSNRRIEISWR